MDARSAGPAPPGTGQGRRRVSAPLAAATAPPTHLPSPARCKPYATASPRPCPHSPLTKPWAEGAAGSLTKAAAFSAARGAGAAPDSIFCTNVSGLKGNSPFLIGMLEYFSVRRWRWMVGVRQS